MDLSWIDDAKKSILEKEKTVVTRNRGKVPYTTHNHRFDDRSGPDQIAWWTNGFWGGILWQLYKATEDPLYRSEAEELEKKQDQQLFNADALSHDSGFTWLPTAVADYRMTGNRAARNRGLLAAGNLAGRFNPAGQGFIRAWNGTSAWGGDTTGWAIIDCMMNLPLLYWASDELKDPRFKNTAMRHADTAMRNFIREDGSARHICEFDPCTGEFVRDYGGQGYGVGSSWTRGQAWALYGFTLSFLHTGAPRYLCTAEKVAAYFLSNIPDDGIILTDFRVPQGEPNYVDSTAAAIASCGLLTLAEQVEKDSDKDENERQKLAQDYRDAALKMLKALYDNFFDADPEDDELIEKCTAAYHDKEHEFTIIYGDYYFIEAIWKLTGTEQFIW
jgi:unsaturated chondroitin disaccharide hydrolase